MIRTIYIAAKPGDERLYPAMNGFSPETADALEKQGFYILQVDLFMPPEFDSTRPESEPIEAIAKHIR